MLLPLAVRTVTHTVGGGAFRSFLLTPVLREAGERGSATPSEPVGSHRGPQAERWRALQMSLVMRTVHHGEWEHRVSLSQESWS